MVRGMVRRNGIALRRVDPEKLGRVDAVAAIVRARSGESPVLYRSKNGALRGPRLLRGLP